jgi:4-diphosphocytidyl-2-C-methyl-D-erythritol kinase
MNSLYSGNLSLKSRATRILLESSLTPVSQLAIIPFQLTLASTSGGKASLSLSAAEEKDFSGHELLISFPSRTVPCSSPFLFPPIHPRNAMVLVQAPAKVNLFLEILKKRPDGYHDLETCMVAISLFDTLRFKENASHEIHLSTNHPSLATGNDNLICRAADLLRRRAGVSYGARIHLTKRIPVSAGLGGGSSDAASTLMGLSRLWKLNLPKADLVQMGSELGSDVGFFFATPAAWCTGRGEITRPFVLKEPLHLLLACPRTGLATAEVFKQIRVPAEPQSGAALRLALKRGELRTIGATLFNRLQPIAEQLRPEIGVLRSLFETLAPSGHLMSGSGTSYFALCRSPGEALKLARRARRLQRSLGNDAIPRLRFFNVSTLGGDQR